MAPVSNPSLFKDQQESKVFRTCMEHDMHLDQGPVSCSTRAIGQKQRVLLAVEGGNSDDAVTSA